jgi:hypothetical protein
VYFSVTFVAAAFFFAALVGVQPGLGWVYDFSTRTVPSEYTPTCR